MTAKVGDRAVYIQDAERARPDRAKAHVTGGTYLNLGTMSTFTTSFCNLDILARWNYETPEGNGLLSGPTTTQMDHLTLQSKLRSMQNACVVTGMELSCLDRESLYVSHGVTGFIIPIDGR